MAPCRTTPISPADAGGLVVSVSPPASAVGTAMLQRGGNAVDAAVAVAFALQVTWPSAGNIGGGGFMMVAPPRGKPVCIEYRETAPSAATPTMFKLGERRFGHKLVGVPGTVRGLARAHEQFGKLQWGEVVLPSVRLAEDGFALNAALVRSLNSALRNGADFPEFARVYGKPGGGTWRAGDRLVQPDLGRTLRSLVDQGADAFYRGAIADQIVAEMKSSQAGLISKADLANYRAKLRTPIHGTYRGHDLYTPPPPSSGGVALVQMLNLLETFDLRRRERWSAETMHLLIETMRRAFLDRARHLGDADFVELPKHLTTKEYARKLAASIDPHRATRSATLAKDIPLVDEPGETTHFSVIDREGMAVANTYTLEGGFGSKVVVRGAGFLLNNEMGDFNWQPGHTDTRGNIGTPANLIAPGKRMLSSMTPTLVLRDGQVVLVTGSPGGRTIINTVLQVVLNLIEFGMTGPEAVAAPRLHHQWLPDRVTFEAVEQPEFANRLQRLRAMGHTLNTSETTQGDAHTIWRDPKTKRYVGIVDQRMQ